MYEVQAGDKTEKFENLNQVYGFLCGVSRIREIRPRFKQFRSWWLARKRRNADHDRFQIKDLFCSIRTV